MRFRMTKGQRIKTRFWWVNTTGMWWSEYRHRWITDEESVDGKYRDEMLSSCRYCNSVRAFRRMLRKNPGMRGRSELVSKFNYNYDVLG